MSGALIGRHTPRELSKTCGSPAVTGREWCGGESHRFRDASRRFGFRMSTLTHVRFGGPTAVVARRSSSGSAAVRVIEYTLDGAPDADPPYRAGCRACCAARQDAWGFLLAHLAIRALRHEAAFGARPTARDPDTRSFVQAVRVIRRTLPHPAAIPPRDRPRVHQAIRRERRDDVVPPRPGRAVPRGVKRTMSNDPLRPQRSPPTTRRRIVVRILYVRSIGASLSHQIATAAAHSRSRRECFPRER